MKFPQWRIRVLKAKKLVQWMPGYMPEQVTSNSADLPKVSLAMVGMLDGADHIKHLGGGKWCWTFSYTYYAQVSLENWCDERLQYSIQDEYNLTWQGLGLWQSSSSRVVHPVGADVHRHAPDIRHPLGLIMGKWDEHNIDGLLSCLKQPHRLDHLLLVKRMHLISLSWCMYLVGNWHSNV